MKALTVRQPWAWAIIHGGKLIENRSPGAIGWRHRGPLAIHAGMRPSERGLADPRVRDAWLTARNLETIFAEDLDYGVVLGTVDLVDIHPASRDCCDPWGEHVYRDSKDQLVRDVAHLELANPQPFDVPVLARGALGLWEWAS